jgi:hypothetical protein
MKLNGKSRLEYSSLDLLSTQVYYHYLWLLNPNAYKFAGGTNGCKSRRTTHATT